MMLRHDVLSAYQVLEAFPDECREYVPVEIKKLEKELRPWLQAAKRVEEEWWPADWKTLAICYLDGMKPKKSFERYKQMLLIAKIMNAPKFEGQITQLDIMLAKEVPIETLWDGWERKRKSKTGFMARCPFGHQDDTPSFGVKNNLFKCFGACGKSGSSIDFVMAIYNIKFLDAVKLIRRK